MHYGFLLIWTGSFARGSNARPRESGICSLWYSWKRVGSFSFMQKHRVQLLILGCIILVAALVRVWDLTNNPPGFFCDEASVGYEAYSVITTGKDSFGRPFPVFFEAFGEYRGPFEVYLTVPFVLVFGLTEFAVRMSSVFWSLAFIATLFFIGRYIKDDVLGLGMAFVVAISPWSIHLSRTGFVAQQTALFLLSVGILAWVMYRRQPTLAKIAATGMFLSLAAYAYFSARIIVPLVAFGIAIDLLMKRRFWHGAVFAGVFFVVSIPLAHHMLFGSGLARWSQAGLGGFVPTPEVESIQDKIWTSYRLHFSPAYLVYDGDIDMPGQFITRHSVRGVGQLYLWQGVLVLTGVVYALWKKFPLWWFFVYFLIFYPLPSSISLDVPPQATRSILGLIPFSYFAGVGVWVVVSLIKSFSIPKKVLSFIVISVIVALPFMRFVVLLDEYKMYAADFWGWQYGPPEVMEYFLQHKDEYDELYLTGYFNGPHIFLKFYDPKETCEQCFVGGFDRYDETKRQLFALRPVELTDIPDEYTVTQLHEITTPNGLTELVIVEIDHP